MSINVPSTCIYLLNRFGRQIGRYRNVRVISALSATTLDSKHILRVLAFSNTKTQRIAATPVIGYLVIANQLVPASLLFVAAGATDLLDGYIARNVPGQSSAIGSIIDPLADKFLVTTLFLTLTYVNLIPAVLTILVITRDVGLIAGGIAKRLRMIRSPLTIKRFFNPKISPFKVTPTFVSKLNTLLQLCVVTFSLAAPIFGFSNHPWLTYLYGITAVTTVFSGLQYAVLDRMKIIK